jgi:peptidoglycan/LPS O-acetylase OafA/YrhL
VGLSSTIQDRLKSAGYRPSGFDYLRLILAVAVIGWHSISVCYGEPLARSFILGPFRPLPMYIVPAFFAMGGFLVTGSFLRNSIPVFMMLRGLRMFPALLFEVGISALILGPLLTTLPLEAYFTNRHFFSYFLNLIAYIHFELPGVFLDLPLPRVVNLQLWTVPHELECYAAIIVLAILGVVKRAKLFATLVVLALLTISFQEIFIEATVPPDQSITTTLLVFSFFFGVLVYVFREAMPHSRSLFVASVALAWTLLSHPSTMNLASIPIAYVTVFLGLLDPQRIFLVDGADYSYGMYIYGFPVQQALADLFENHRKWHLNVAGTLLLAGFLSYLSWTYVESTALAQKDRLLRLAGNVKVQLKLLLRLSQKGFENSLRRMVPKA